MITETVFLTLSFLPLSRSVENMLRWQLTNRNQKWDIGQKRDSDIRGRNETNEELE